MISIDEQKCVSCGLCISDCPLRCIGYNNRNSVSIDYNLCIGCGHCYAVCPKEAVSMPVSNQPFNYKNRLEEVIVTRRSTRRYTDMPVEKDDLSRIISLGAFYPSATNQKKVCVMVIKNKKVLRTVRALIEKQLLKGFSLLNNTFIAGIFKLLLKDSFKKINKYNQIFSPILKLGNEDIILFDAPCLVVVHTNKKVILGDEDCHYAAYNMMVEAHNLGLGTCFVGFARRVLNTSAGKKLLGIPKDHTIYTCFTLGYPVCEYRRQVIQAPLNVEYLE